MSHRDLAERFMTALKAGDFDTMATLITPDFVLHEPDGLPYAGDYRGIEGWRDLTARVTTAWAGFRIERIEYFGETNDSLVIRMFLKGRSRTTGKAFETTVLELWRFKSGLLSEISPHYWDTHALAALDSP